MDTTEAVPVSRVDTNPGDVLPTRDRMPAAAYVAGALLALTVSLGTVLVGLMS